MGSATAKLIVSVISALCIFAFSASGVALPTAADISADAASAGKIAAVFLQQSTRIRLSFDCSGAFLSEVDREELRDLAEKASGELDGIYRRQRYKKALIEDYTGDDWDRLYGRTGLWRKVAADAQVSLWLKCQVDYYLALACDPARQTEILQGIIDKTRTGDDIFKGPGAQLVRAKAYMLMSHLSRTYSQWAQKDLDGVLATGNLPDRIYFEAMMSRLAIIGPAAKEQLSPLAEGLARSTCRDDFELNMKLAFLEMKFSGEESCAQLEWVVKAWPQAEGLAGMLILSDIADQADLKNRCALAIELAAWTALKNGPTEYTDLLGRLCKIERFQTPLVLFAAGQALEELQPEMAAKLYLQAAIAQNKSKSRRLDAGADDIARKAAALAWQLYQQDHDSINVAVETLVYYCRIAGSQVDEQMEYVCAGLLNESGQGQPARMKLQEIARRSGRFSNRARLDLIECRIKDNPDTAYADAGLMSDLEKLIASAKPDSDDTLAVAATELYCQLLLQDPDVESAGKALEMLSRTPVTQKQAPDMLKARALRHLGRLPEAVAALADAVDTPSGTDRCRPAPEALMLLAEINPRIDDYRQNAADWPGFIADCEKLARLAYGCTGEDYARQAALIFAEITVLADDGSGPGLARAEQILDSLVGKESANDIDYLRCRARLLAARNEHARAARLWGRICQEQKSTNSTDIRTWNWWRAKCYQLTCFANMPDTGADEVDHAVEVLLGSYREVPDIWAMRLSELKITK